MSKHRIKLTLFKHSRSRVNTRNSVFWYHLIPIGNILLGLAISTTRSFPRLFRRLGRPPSISTRGSSARLYRHPIANISYSFISRTIPSARRWLIRKLWTTSSKSSLSACHEHLSIGSWPSTRLFRQLDHKIFYIDDFPSARQNHQMVLQLIGIEDRFINLTAKIAANLFWGLYRYRINWSSISTI